MNGSLENGFIVEILVTLNWILGVEILVTFHLYQCLYTLIHILFYFISQRVLFAKFAYIKNVWLLCVHSSYWAFSLLVEDDNNLDWAACIWFEGLYRLGLLLTGGSNIYNGKLKRYYVILYYYRRDIFFFFFLGLANGTLYCGTDYLFVEEKLSSTNCWCLMSWHNLLHVAA